MVLSIVPVAFCRIQLLITSWMQSASPCNRLATLQLVHWCQCLQKPTGHKWLLSNCHDSVLNPKKTSLQLFPRSKFAIGLNFLFVL